MPVTNTQRLEFVTRHFRDLQTIRFAPVPTAMILAFAVYRMRHVSASVARGLLLSFLLSTGGFYWWSTVAIRRRYGSIKPSREETQRMQRHPAIAVLHVILAAALIWFGLFARHTYYSDVYIAGTIFIVMLMTILDTTNLASRRIAWAVGLVALSTAGPFLVGVAGGAAIFALAGAVWLSLSIFDFLLLRRILARKPAMEAILRDG
jgi:hypothetical protein